MKCAGGFFGFSEEASRVFAEHSDKGKRRDELTEFTIEMKDIVKSFGFVQAVRNGQFTPMPYLVTIVVLALSMISNKHTEKKPKSSLQVAK